MFDVGFDRSFFGCLLFMFRSLLCYLVVLFVLIVVVCVFICVLIFDLRDSCLNSYYFDLGYFGLMLYGMLLGFVLILGFGWVGVL